MKKQWSEVSVRRSTAVLHPAGGRLSLCALAVMMSVASAQGMGADAVPAAAPTASGGGGDQALTFDDDFMSMADGGKGKGKDHVDLSYFAHRGGMMPGDYPVQVKVNDKMVDDGRMLTFRSWPDQPGRLYACVTRDMLTEWGVKSEEPKVVTPGKTPPVTDPAAAAPPATRAAASADCPVGGVVSMVPWSSEKFDYNKKLLAITVPQASLGAASEMRTPPSRWDEGIPALLMNYNYSGSQQSNQGARNGSDFLSLNGQLNVLGWRVRSGLAWHRSDRGGSDWNTRDVYAQHDYSFMRGGQFSVGRLTSDGSMVDSVPFTGVSMASDTGMLNPSATGYRPAITGIANSPATVTVRQFGKVIYQQNVPQGPFALTDFNRSGNGDVEVEIREADGSVRRFTMSSAVAPMLMNAGEMGYSMSAGQAQNTGSGNSRLSTSFVQGNLSYGTGGNTSLLAGMLLSQDYQQISAGGGWYSGLLGAFSLTSSLSAIRLSSFPGEHGQLTGVSSQFTWSRNIGGATVGMAATRYGSKNFHTYSDALGMTPDTLRSGTGQRASYQVSLSRSLGVFGSLSLTGNQTQYWGGEATQRGYTVSYSTTVKDIGVSLSAGLNTTAGTSGSGQGGFSQGPRNDRSMTLNISLPLAKWLGGSSTMSGNYMYSRYNGRANQQAGVSGSALDSKVNYSASTGWGDSDSSSTSVGYSGKYTAMSAGYNMSGSDNHGWSYGMSGAVLVHPQGITLAKSLSLDGANALIELPGVGGVRIAGVETDWRGYAVVSGLTPYDLNKLSVNMTNLPGNVEVDSSSKATVPTRGSVVRVRFTGSQGYRVLFTLARAGGGDIPFGAVVSLKKQDKQAPEHTGIVGDSGQAYMSGLPDKGKLLVTWADGSDGRCTADYSLPQGTDEKRLSQVTATCR
ncbi:fimbrial biogenesis outer membrane usher protein [Enterobacter ludwigii]|uniref:fimbria/pilus outer membrane usher protein n=1 Tax=Enterobacter ludwigii TaxID=299767 RepID=UPI00242ED347|nr:fimbria/pilus outer membrane usher protein [Enterobacter ludwigii]WGA03951.1 fimbrial biogenesis outer membrane usher protein [Enterobacter ludwigii]